MADSPLNAPDGPARKGLRLTKDERKELLAEIERQLSRAETPKRTLERADQALADGNLDQARRLRQHLESIAPSTPGLEGLKAKIQDAERREQRRSSLQQAEEMLQRYIRQRKKPLAEMALATLIEIAPEHPRRSDYQRWVADLDRELALQQRVENELGAGRAALRTGDLGLARRHLATLRKLDPTGPATDELTRELATEEEVEAESADIERLKQRADKLLANERIDEAEREVERLAVLDVPKLTIDFLRRRLAEARRQIRDRFDAERLLALFEDRIEARDWQGAREVAHRYGERFPDLPDAARLFSQVTGLEADERRQQSLQEGLRTLEGFLAAGQRREAELALELLERLNLDPDRLAQLRQKVRGL